MKPWTSIAVLIWALASPQHVGAQPSDLFTCLGSREPTCFDVGGGLISTDCPRFFFRYYGRIAWYPLRCIGPITVSVESFATWDTRFPLYVEVVPYRDPTQVCQNAAGNVILVVHGGTSICGDWETTGPVDITSVVSLGSLYAIRVHFFGHPAGDSPGMDCIRVTAQPSAVLPITWSNVKHLYRD